MVQFIQRQEDPSVRIGQLLGGIAEKGMQGYQQGKAFKINEEDRVRLEKEFGTKFSTDPAIRKEQIKELMKAERKKSELKSLSDLMGNKGNKGNKSQEPTSTQEPKQSDGGLSGFDYSMEDELDADLPDPMFKYALASVNPTLGSIASQEESNKRKDIREGKKEKRRIFESDREFHTKRSGPVVAEAMKVLAEAPISEGLLRQQRIANSTGNVSGFAEFAIDQLGLEWARSPESAEFRNAAKNRYINSLKSLGGGARLNQFLEKQIADAQPLVGRSVEANDVVLDMEEFVEDMKVERAKYVKELAREDREKYGYERADIDDRADDLMRDYSTRRQELMAQNIRRRHENNFPTDEELAFDIFSKPVPSGTPLTERVARILMIKNNDDAQKAQAEAKRLGFVIPRD